MLHGILSSVYLMNENRDAPLQSGEEEEEGNTHAHVPTTASWRELAYLSLACRL